MSGDKSERNLVLIKYEVYYVSDRFLTPMMTMTFQAKSEYMYTHTMYMKISKSNFDFVWTEATRRENPPKKTRTTTCHVAILASLCM